MIECIIGNTESGDVSLIMFRQMKNINVKFEVDTFFQNNCHELNSEFHIQNL